MSGDDQRMLQALKKVAVALKHAEVPFALAGGYAAFARGGPRPSHDVDFYLNEDDIERAREVLAVAGLRPETPPEDWLTKVFDDDVMVDLIFRPNGRAVDHEMLARATERDVDSVFMPVLDSTDLLTSKLMALTEHYCDLAGVLPTARALREQIDWSRARRETADNPFAEAFFLIADRLGLIDGASAAA
jgi:hypothetical protein